MKAYEDVECCETVEIHSDVIGMVKSNLPDEEQLYDLAELFKVFGDSTRIRILFVLFEAEMCVNDIAQLLNISTSAISSSMLFLSIFPRFALLIAWISSAHSSMQTVL